MLHRLPWNDYFAFDGRVSTWFLCVCGRGGDVSHGSVFLLAIH